ncbi:MAG: hypothetical protein JXA99_00275 [Candidatus Lokiarchaeota archaeon]|nr:hypothetical protein [Candidatus Lokiarchaeota archaeon]
MNQNKKLKGLLLIFLFIVPLFFTIYKIFPLNDTLKNNIIRNSGNEIIPSRDWITNGNLDNTDYWIIENGTGGDTNDINADISGGEFNSNLLGDWGQKSVILNSSASEYNQWDTFIKTGELLQPDNYGIDSTGVWCNHNFDDNAADQVPIIHFKREVMMDQPMDDYEITSASLEVHIDAECDLNIDTPQDYIDGNSANQAQNPIDNPQSFDFCKFNVEISDFNTNDLNTYEMGSNQTVEFGYGDPPSSPDFASDYLTGFMEIKDQQTIIDALTNVFSVHSTNFTVIIGIFINCADNYGGQERDYWRNLSIDYLNLTITYEKVIDQSTSIRLYQNTGSFSQDLSDNGYSSYNSYSVDLARLNFTYKVDPYWPSDSQNSDVRISLNNGTTYVSQKLILADTNPSDISCNLIDLIKGLDDIEVSIIIFIADEFNLNETIEVSIDSISLEIEYTVYFDDYSTSIEVDIDGQPYIGLIHIPVFRELDIVVRYLNDTLGAIYGADVILSGDAVGDLTPNGDHYDIKLNTTEDLSIGLNTITIEATKNNYLQSDTIINIYVDPIDGEISGYSGNFVSNEIYVDTGVLEFIELYLNDTDNNLPIIGATVTYTGGLGNGIFTDPNNDGIYNATIIAPSPGYFSITVSAVKGPDYDISNYQFAIDASTPGFSDANLTLFINNEEIGSGGSFSISSLRNINITAIFINATDGDPINSADIELRVSGGGQLIGELSEISGYYELQINSTNDLDLGVQLLTLTATRNFFNPEDIDFNIEVLRIQTELSLNNINGTTLSVISGGNAFIEVVLNDTDNNLPIIGATVTFIWDQGSGVLFDLDGDGIYNTTIINIPEGSWDITISAVTQAQYYAFNPLIMHIDSRAPVGADPILYIIITAILGIAVIGLGTYFAIYQKILKYPPTVRKIRKLKGKIGKGKKPKSVDFDNRTSYIKEIYEENKIFAQPVSYKTEIKK